MDTTTNWILAAIGAVLILGILLLLRRSRSTRATGGEVPAGREALDTLSAWQPQATRVLTDAECGAYRVLARAFPGHLVLAQVPIARFIRVPTRYSYREWLRRVGSQCADLVICDRATQVLAVVSVRPARPQSERALKRHARLARVLGAAQIPLYLWVEGALPSVEGARRQIDLASLETAEEAAPALIEADADGGQSMPRLPPRRGAPGSPAVPQPDEVVELHEPPASTWFDDFDSRAAPLDEPQPARKPGRD